MSENTAENTAENTLTSRQVSEDSDSTERLWDMLPASLPDRSKSAEVIDTELATLPSMRSMYLKALKRRPGLRRGESIPPLQVESVLSIDSPWLKRYLKVCGWAESAERVDDPPLPITAPQTLAAPLHMYLLTHPLFPAPTLGVVHAANQMIATRHLDLSAPLRLRGWIGETRWKARGFEVDLHTAVMSQGEDSPSWLGKTTIFRSVKEREERPRAASVEDPIIEGERSDLNLSADLGRRFAPIAGDYNPIHLYPLTARLFGFKRPIIHGMWTIAHLLQRGYPHAEEAQLGRMSVLFRRPLSLPLNSNALLMSTKTGRLLQALDHRGKLAVSAAFCPLDEDAMATSTPVSPTTS